MQAFIKAYHGNTDHPVLQDFLAIDAAVRRRSRPRSTRSLISGFSRSSFPNIGCTEPKKTAQGKNGRRPSGSRMSAPDVMPVEVAATRGDRFAKDGSPNPDYREARATSRSARASHATS